MSTSVRAHRAVAIAIALLLALAAQAPSPAPAPAQSKRGEIVRINYGGDDGTLTPYTFTRNYVLMTLVYDTLLWRDEDGIPRPWLARSVDTSADGRTLTVRLATNARWHDGRPVTARDVAFTLNYVRRVWHPRFTPQLRELQRVTVTGRHSLRLRLRRPSPGFRDQPLADLPILPRHLWAPLPRGFVPTGWPVGSGPYRLVRYRYGRGMYAFAANRSYFRGQPGVQRIEIANYTDNRATTRAWERGRLDAARLAYESSGSLLEARGEEIVRGDGYLGALLVFDTRGAPFKDARLRRAVAQALDLAPIARAAAGATITITPARNGMIHPRSRWATRENLELYDPDAARAGLRRLNGRELRVLVERANRGLVNAGRVVVAGLRRAGARARLVRLSEARFDSALGVDRPRANFDIAISALSQLGSYDPDGLRQEFSRTGTLNYSGYRSAAFERLADRVTTARPARARRALVAEQLRLLARDVPALPLFFESASYVYRPAVWDGWVFMTGRGIFDKQSFLARPASRATPRRAAVAATPTDGAGIGALGFVAAGLALLAAAIVAVGSVRRQR